ncbi:MAG: porin [Mariprofundus sp.]|nr:porin [Mariprofundus sp.]
MKRFIVVLIMLFAGLQSAQAGGYQIPEAGIKAMGMANAFTAVADDASALWYNPAGLAFAKSGQVIAGGVLIAPNMRHTSNAGVGTSAKNDLALVPHLYISDIQEDTGIAWGLGVNAPFGTKMEWPTTAPFAANALFGNLEGLIINPNIAFKISDHFAISVGVDYGWLKNVDFDTAGLKQNFNGDGWGYNVGLLYKTDKFNFGATYRSKITVDAKGTSTIPALAATTPNTIQVTLPDMFSAGVAFVPVDSLTVSLNVDWVNWKKFNELAFKYSAPGFPLGASLTVPENWKATTSFRIGAEWAYSESLRLRAGYTYDPTPVADPEFTPLLPSNDINSFSTGLGYDMSDSLTVDLAYMYVKIKDRQQTLSVNEPGNNNATRNGLYKADLHLFGSSMTYHF